MRRPPATYLLLVAALGACRARRPRGRANSRRPPVHPGGGERRNGRERLGTPLGLVLLPDGRMLVTERRGRLRIVTRDGVLSASLTGAPAVAAVGQGGLLDVALDPRLRH